MILLSEFLNKNTIRKCEQCTFVSRNNVKVNASWSQIVYSKLLTLNLSKLMLGVNDISVYTLQTTQSRETNISASVNQRSIAHNGRSGSVQEGCLMVDDSQWCQYTHWTYYDLGGTHYGKRTTRFDRCVLWTVALKL